MQLKKGKHVRIAFEDNALAGTMRWEYGKVMAVHTGGELVDVDLVNGQPLPTFDFEHVPLPA